MFLKNLVIFCPIHIFLSLLHRNTPITGYLLPLPFTVGMVLCSLWLVMNFHLTCCLMLRSNNSILVSSTHNTLWPENLQGGFWQSSLVDACGFWWGVAFVFATLPYKSWWKEFVILLSRAPIDHSLSPQNYHKSSYIISYRLAISVSSRKYS